MSEEMKPVETKLEEPIVEKVKLTLGTVVIIALVALIAGTMVGVKMGKISASSQKEDPTHFANLQQFVPGPQAQDIQALQNQLAELKRFAGETAPLVINLTKRLDVITDNQNRLVEAIQRNDAQKSYEMGLVGRALRNLNGKDKWEAMLNQANKEFVDEATKAEQAKAKVEAEVVKPSTNKTEVATPSTNKTDTVQKPVPPVRHGPPNRSPLGAKQ